MNKPIIARQNRGCGLTIIVLGKWIEAKQTNAKIVPIKAPFVDDVFVITESARLVRKSDLAKRLRTNNSRTNVVRSLGL